MEMEKERYAANLGAFSQKELDAICNKSVCVIGCGGLGGYVCNALARFGAGHITVVDGDDFSESNLNRQLFARPDTLGKNKASVCAQELAAINGDIELKPVCRMLSASNAASILSGHDLVIDCLDSHETRILLEDCCEQLSLPLVHGAINGFSGQVALVFPGDGLLRRLYSGWKAEDGARGKSGGSPVFTVQTVAAIQCSEAIKLLLGRNTLKKAQLLHINLEDNRFNLINV